MGIEVEIASFSQAVQKLLLPLPFLYDRDLGFPVEGDVGFLRGVASLKSLSPKMGGGYAPD